MECLASTLHTTSEHVVFSITTADAHTSAASIRLNWRPRRFKWTRPFCRKMKSGFCACAITFQLASTLVRISNRIVTCYASPHRHSRRRLTKEAEICHEICIEYLPNTIPACLVKLHPPQNSLTIRYVKLHTDYVQICSGAHPSRPLVSTAARAWICPFSHTLCWR